MATADRGHPPQSGFAAFISYSSAADGGIAPALHDGLQRLAKPWYRRRALDVYLDTSDLEVTPGLWSTLTSALDTAEYFVLLASPAAARSPWVDKEVRYWITT